MDDLYCPACDLVLYASRLRGLELSHCPRCRARRGRLVALLPVERDAPPAGEPDQPAGSRSRTESARVAGHPRTRPRKLVHWPHWG